MKTKGEDRFSLEEGKKGASVLLFNKWRIEPEERFFPVVFSGKKSESQQY